MFTHAPAVSSVLHHMKHRLESNGVGAVNVYRLSVDPWVLPTFVDGNSAEKSTTDVKQFVAAWACANCCRGCILFLTLYFAIAVVALTTTPFPACVTTFGGLEKACKCTCGIADVDNPDKILYHPGGPGHLTFDNLALVRNSAQFHSVQPDTGTQEFICGQCPINEDGQPYDACRDEALAQPRPNAVNTVANASLYLTCYRPQCTAITKLYYNQQRNDGGLWHIKSPTVRERMCDIVCMDHEDQCGTRALAKQYGDDGGWDASQCSC